MAHPYLRPWGGPRQWDAYFSTKFIEEPISRTTFKDVRQEYLVYDHKKTINEIDGVSLRAFNPADRDHYFLTSDYDYVMNPPSHDLEWARKVATVLHGYLTKRGNRRIERDPKIPPHAYPVHMDGGNWARQVWPCRVW